MSVCLCERRKAKERENGIRKMEIKSEKSNHERERPEEGRLIKAFPIAV